MQKSKTQTGFLGFLESIIRRHAIIYYFARSIIIHFGIFEEDFNILSKFFRNKPLNIIDVGASDGIAAKFFLKKLNVKKIYCFEPHDFFVKKLKKLKNKNKNIVLNNYGIGNEKEKIKIYYPSIKFLSFNLPILTYSFYDKKELKKQMQLDFFNYKKLNIDKSLIQLKKYRTINKKIDLIKIDVNGYESQIIKAILKQIKKDKPLLVIENNEKLKEIDLLLKKYGYKKYYNKFSNFKIHKNEKVLDIFFINKKRI